MSPTTPKRASAHALAAVSLALVAGCAAPPPSVTRVVANPTVADAGGILVMVDVCVNYSPLAGGDYFVVSNARQGASAMESVVRQFLDAADLRRRTLLVPFVCGALHDQPEAPKRVADDVDAPVSERAQPLWVASELASDADYVRALQALATHVSRRSVAAYDKGKPPAPGSSSQDSAADDERARDAATVVAHKSGHTSLLYVGVTGNSLSSQKAFAIGAARVVAGVALSMAIGPVYTTGATQYHVVFVPGGAVDTRQMAAGLLDLKQGKLMQSRVVSAGGDPMKPEVLAGHDGLNLLLRDMLLSAAR